MTTTKFDLLLQNGKIVDGTGNPWYRGDVALKDGRIAKIGGISKADAEQVLDIGGKVLAPGFIDIHTHSDFAMFGDRVMLNKLTQGVTTQLLGQCGMSAAPVNPATLEVLKAYSGFVMAGVEVDWNWTTYADWLKQVENLKLAWNVAPCVGHGTVRIAVMGFENRRATRDEIDQMKALTREAMEAGCFALTSGLIYPPGVYAPDEELWEMAGVLAQTGGFYMSHMRSESNDLVQSVLDTIEVGRRAGIPVQISHHKALGKGNWGKVKETLAHIDAARAQGIDVTIDQYPYTRCSTSVRASLPPWVQEGGVAKICERLRDPETRGKVGAEIEHSMDLSQKCNWESMLRHSGGPAGALIVYSPLTPEWEGKNLQEIAEMEGTRPIEAAFDLITANKGNDLACYDAISDDDVKSIIRHPATMIGSDSIPAAKGAKAHPRSYGTHTRVLAQYVREEKVLTLEEAIKKMTAFPASRLGLQHKGIIREGMDADIVVFDEKKIQDNATFAEPVLCSSGMEYVFVNGVKVLEGDSDTGAMPGRLLRRS